MKFNVSDWVQGKTGEGELIQGFIETMDILQGIATVYVVHSDNEATIGKVVAVREQWVRKLPDNTLEDAQYVQNLIDMALATRDKEWFMELTNELKSIESGERNENEGAASYPFHHNRLGPAIR
ncbi:IDEAL domain-containing protein [Paenibacillus arenilitoris]|uniref:IDEAL domain-containing protein n=1 Tax=Paenibacillus arenilitoris TaxID=2772299 RepID=A0A927H7S3_9BACL|nr:IDEAL domain-containing protein [Paenibacillus arenilitoris]MBD2871325.1 IDEAL domain-containing protein [Paenibacillus arenilitoris]